MCVDHRHDLVDELPLRGGGEKNGDEEGAHGRMVTIAAAQGQ